MGAPKATELMPASAYSYAVSLRARHSSLDPARLTETLRLDPEYSWKAGDPRRSQTGAAIGGQHRDSYWCAPLAGDPAQAIGQPLELFVAQQLAKLGRHRSFFQQLQEEGAEISLVIEVSPVPNAVLTLSSAVTRKLAELNLEVELQFLGD